MEINLGNIGKDLESSSNQIEKVLIIGSGPAGLAAGLYAARAELSPLILSGTELGGQAALTHTIENYPGFPEGVGGPQLGELFQKQAERFGARVEFSTVSEVDFSQRPFRTKTYDKEYLAETVIIATGARSIKLGVAGENELTGRGVSYCATCDGWFFKGKNVIVVGGGDSALEEALFLTRYAASVTIVHRRDSLRAGQILQRRAFSDPKISFIWNSILTEILGEEKTTGVRIKSTVNGELSILPIDGVFVFIGHAPNTELFKGQIDLDDKGYIKADHLMQTSVPGIFAAGEVMDSHFRQVITSAGMGAGAAIQATHFLQENK